MRRTQLGLAVALAAVLAAAGCGSGGTPSGGGSSAAGGGMPDLTGQKLEFIGIWSAAEQEAFQAVLKNFSDKTHAEVTYTSGGNNTNVLINSRLAGGSPPDLAAIGQPGVVAQFAQKGAIKPLTGDVLTAVKNNFSDAWQQLGQVNGQQYGFHFKVANKSTVWYRADAFDQAGVKAPATWDDFTKASKTLSDAGTTPMAIPGGDGWPTTDWFENIYLRVAGVDKYKQLTDHKIAWTDPTVVQSLQLWADYLKQPGFIEKGATQLSFTQSVADVFGAQPKAAMLFEGDFVAGEIQKSGKVQVGTGAKFFPWPAVNGSKPSVVTGGDEVVMFKDNPGARALAAYLASPEAAAIWAAKGGFLSANKNVAASTYPDDTTRQIADALGKSEQVAFDMSDQTPQAFGGETGADMWKLLTDFVGNPGNPAGTAAALEAAAVKDYGSK